MLSLIITAGHNIVRPCKQGTPARETEQGSSCQWQPTDKTLGGKTAEGLLWQARPARTRPTGEASTVAGTRATHEERPTLQEAASS